MAGPFAPSGRRAAARRRTPGGLGPRTRPRPRCGLGLGAALRAGLSARASASPPHTPPARLGAAGGKAEGCQPCGLVGAPVRALWARPGQVGPQPLLGGTPPRRKAKPLRGALRAALPRSSPSPVAASVLRRGPAPTLWGLWGRPRLRPGRAWLRPAAPRWPACGSARAGAALPALGPPGVAAPPRSRRPAAKPRGGVRALWGAARARPQFRRRALGPCPLCGSRPLSASRAAGARGLRRLRAGRPHRSTSGKAKASRLRRALPDDLRRGKGGQGDAAPCGRSPRPTVHR